MDIIPRTIDSVLTLYLLFILLRWLGPWLSLELEGGYLRFIPRLTDPLLKWVRSMLPPNGPMDFAPLVSVLGVWLIREILLLNTGG